MTLRQKNGLHHQTMQRVQSTIRRRKSAEETDWKIAFRKRCDDAEGKQVERRISAQLSTVAGATDVLSQRLLLQEEEEFIVDNKKVPILTVFLQLPTGSSRRRSERGRSNNP
jgi:hypothetical protein